MKKLDLSGIPAIDNHCHPFPYGREAKDFERALCIGLYPVESEDMRHTILYHMMTNELKRFFKMDAGASQEEVVKQRNKARSMNTYVQDLIKDAGLEALLVDFGYPITRKTLTSQEISDFYKEVGDTKVYGINRIEWVAEKILAEEPSFDEFTRRLKEDTVAMIKNENLVAVKSVIAYLTGLKVEVLSEEEFRSGYYAYLADPQDIVAEKKVRDYTFLKGCEICREQDVPLQIHTGLGDSPDCNMLQCNPLLLFDAINSSYCQGTKIVLIHASYPYLEELGILLNHYTNIYADVSSMIPYASFAADDKLLKLFEMAPLNKIFYGSDGAGVPEHMWLAARFVRKSLARALETLMDRGYITEEYAMKAARNILCDNLRRVYKI
ncbi:amidohydrolase family protein [Faecalicatena acetigenes]|uniref:Amidohydrolase family protein n=1 Tax=Faecalicatena acetigenes TaxID=2981790 RepID=A0ABT2TFK1_9FIRM|nr:MULTISPECIES: amidohydrolase family protein [Lachnospiraceae]MCU6748776.1 amidohydrolase family protein [Faecalicatena acetigenes]SCI64863.1 Predicted metal-dependent hydrolase of the TIM-barrel fold [uncultured Clostridium sp.]